MKRGFTLIELLVVIAVIGILATVVIRSVNSARSKARNTQRTSDIKQLVNAFNLALPNTGGDWPASAGWWCISATCYGGFSIYPANATVDAFLAPYIQKPVDPPGGSRGGFGGYMYYKDLPQLVGLYDGYIFETGSYVLWMLEPPIYPNACASGHIYYADSSYVECFLKL